MEKQLVFVSYWLGLVSALLSLALRLLNLTGLVSGTVTSQGQTLWYMTFFKGAVLFFLVAIATANYAAVRGAKS